MSEKKALTLFGKKKWKNTRLFNDEKYQHCYEYFYNLGKKNGLIFYEASYQWYNPEKKVFKNAWTYEDNHWKKVHNIKPDLIYDKTVSSLESHYFKNKIETDFKIINDPRFTLLINNKFYTSLIFPKYFKKSYRISSKKDLLNLSAVFNSKKIVLKPTQGSGGEGIQIINKKRISSLSALEEKTIVQEFIDSSNGIDGVIKGTHDLRLVFVNEKLIYSYIRQPEKGSLLANISQGGQMSIIEPREIPNDVLPIIKDVQAVLKQYLEKIYTIDLIFDKKQKPWIVELNTMPGMYFYENQKKWMDKFYLELISLFKKTIQ